MIRNFSNDDIFIVIFISSGSNNHKWTNLQSHWSSHHNFSQWDEANMHLVRKKPVDGFQNITINSQKNLKSCLMLSITHCLKIHYFSVALWRISVGGAVARILLLAALRSILFRVFLSVVCMLGPSSIPKFLMVSGVLNPWFWRLSFNSGEQLTHRIVDLRTLMLSPLTPVYLL